MSHIDDIRNSIMDVKEKPMPQESHIDEMRKLKDEGYSLEEIHNAIDDMDEMNDKETAKKEADGVYQNAHIVIIRHGSTKLNSEDKVRGWLDIPLDEIGKKEALSLGDELKEGHIDGLVVSDLTRTVQTAAAICKQAHIPILEVTSALRPWDVGRLSGYPGEQVAPKMEEYARNTPDEHFEGGESFNGFRTRFIEKIKEIQKEYPGKTIGIVTHHRGDRLFAAWEKKGKPDDGSVDLDTFFEKGIEPGEARNEGERINGTKDKNLA